MRLRENRAPGEDITYYKINYLKKVTDPDLMTRCYNCSAELADDPHYNIRGRVESGEEVNICNNCYHDPKLQNGKYWRKGPTNK